MSVFLAGQDVDRSLHAVDVLVRVQQRLEAAGDEAAAEALHHFLRLSPDELDRLVALEVGVLTHPEQGLRELTSECGYSQTTTGEVAA